jgi:ABC-type nickel/cobalt efflux system permease component RcnA
MNDQLALLAVTAATIGFFHTLMGPDHYLPFIVLSRARGWSLARTSRVTLLCGLGHVLSSVVLGLVGIALGVAVGSLEAVESWRGTFAAWLLIAVGLVYGVWGLQRALRNRGHRHFHFPVGRRLAEVKHHQDHGLGLPHDHGDGHRDHAHGPGHHEPAREAVHHLRLTPWVLFIVFVLGPCEPLIPLLMYPAAVASWGGVALVTAVFGGVTLATMLGAVLLGARGLDLVPLGRLERFSHALAGGAIFLSGLAIQFLGL